MTPRRNPRYSRPKNRWYYSEILTRPHEYQIPESNLDHIREVLWFDMISEFDARILNAYLDRKLISVSEDFLARKSEWLLDENNHFQGFRLINEILRAAPDEIAAVYKREGDFSHIDHLLQDEFSAALVLAYDEIVTTRGYIDDLPIYDQFHPQVGKFIRLVIADEAQHYSKFMNFVRQRHRQRINEVPSRVQEIRKADGQRPYRATFVLDHIEDIFSSELLDQCADILVRTLQRPIRGEVPESNLAAP